MKIDKCDMDLIQDHNWSLSGSGYFRVTIDGKNIFLHRIIAERVGLDCSDQIDHIDGDKENNHRSNLRSATRSQNAMNRKKHSDNTSGHTGVYYHKASKKWCARINVNGKRVHLGLFRYKKDAITARLAVEIKYSANSGESNGPLYFRT